MWLCIELVKCVKMREKVSIGEYIYNYSNKLWKTPFLFTLGISLKKKPTGHTMTTHTRPKKRMKKLRKKRNQ